MICICHTKSYCKEDIKLIENYNLAINDKENIWDCHHKLEIRDGYINTRSDLIKMNLYYNRPANELIFLKHNEHTSLHLPYRKGSKRSIETCRKISEALKGRYKGRSISEEVRKKLSVSLKGRTYSEQTKLKLSASKRGNFGELFYEKYNCLKRENLKLYNKEYHFFKANGYCSWEK